MFSNAEHMRLRENERRLGVEGPTLKSIISTSTTSIKNAFKALKDVVEKARSLEKTVEKACLAASKALERARQSTQCA